MSDRIQIVLNFIDKVSFAGIFNKLLNLIEFFHTARLPNCTGDALWKRAEKRG
jgi:hypothetical protein